MKKNAPELKIIILGAGMSGLLAGIHLKKEGIQSFEILEMANDVGGTWRDNTYPGLSCDVPAHTYDYSFEPNWRWRSAYAQGHELHEYFKSCADKYEITPHIRFGTRITRIIYEDNGWTVSSADGKTRRADVVINCLGVLVHPSMPDIKGLADFKGASFHSARWDHTVPLDNKKIGVIGTGSTAVQIVTALAERAGHLSMFQRTAQWIIPGLNVKRPELLRQLYRRIPAAAVITGKLQNQIFENFFCRAVTGNQTLLNAVEKMALSHLNTVKDKQLRTSLTPNFKIGCRRIIVSDGFYKAIQQYNVSLVTNKISHIEEKGIRTEDGQLHELDVLVLATGFHALDYTRNLVIQGENGINLADIWKNGSRAYRGVAVAGFPNMFMMIGPHSPVGNFSLTGISEIQIDYIMQLIRMLRQGSVTSIQPKLEAQNKYNQYLAKGVSKTVWASGCTSWYIGPDNMPQTYPYPPSQYRHEMKRVNLKEFSLNK